MSMRKRQKAKQNLYPKWGKQDSPARLAKDRDNWQCVDCHIDDRTLVLDEQGNPRYILYLHASHLSSLDPDYWRTEPIEGQRMRARCPRCHRLYDLYWQAREAEVEHQRRLHRILIDRFFQQRFMRVL
ncbi:MAG TPA: hypothetical protein VF458_19295 [Ktedonobacteraceae bacterium]